MKKVLLGLLMVAGGANVLGMDSDEDPVFIGWKEKISFGKTISQIELCHIQNYLNGNISGLVTYIGSFESRAKTAQWAEKADELNELKDALDDWKRPRGSSQYINRLKNAINARITVENGSNVRCQKNRTCGFRN